MTTKADTSLATENVAHFLKSIYIATLVQALRTSCNAQCTDVGPMNCISIRADSANPHLGTNLNSITPVPTPVVPNICSIPLYKNPHPFEF